jgi:penicillin amidase
LRRPSPITAVLATIVLVGTLYIGAKPLGSAPALGTFLDPIHGVWAVATRANLPASDERHIATLGSTVEVKYDDRGVPHIFATNTSDAYRALGYVHARDRLFEMEMQTRAVAGTLSELAGPRTLPLDREARAQGLAWGATKTFKSIDPASPAAIAIRAYADGVNAYIDQMTPADLPLEFRLLDVKPMHWEPVYTAYLQARMGLTLAYSDGELRRVEAEALVGKAAVDALFPANAPIQEPIQPNGQKAPRFDWQKIPAPVRADEAKLARARDLEAVSSAFAASNRFDGEMVVGSNSWAVSPQRTAAGHALLSGDPHLSLSMPSVWYEVHLSVPDTVDVYGVSFVGSPIVPIGFNRNVAWSATNTGADVADYYVEQVDDQAHPTKYKLDGEWKPLVTRVETVHGKHGEALATDTIYHTHRGPMLHAGKQWVSRRWLVVESPLTGAANAFALANRAKSSAELLAGFTEYTVPAQNIITADRGGHIAIRSFGHYPIRPASAPRGDVLVDGTSSANDWKGFRPVSEYPQAMDPAQGYLASANQQPKDPKVDPTYFGWDWATPWRAMRINHLLRDDAAVTPDAMRRYQTDPGSEQVPLFQKAFTEAVASVPANGRDSALVRGARLLAEFDGRYTRENERGVLYDATVDELARRTWDELQTPADNSMPRRRVVTPNSMMLADLLQDPTNPWWDDRSTVNVVESRDDMIRAAIAAAYTSVVKQYGEPGPAWKWTNVRHSNVNHLLRLPALSRLNVPVQSAPSTLSPSSGDGTHGASWRMVVELGDDVRAWGIYPGGQSGNPSSRRYDDRLKKWSAGELDTLRFPHKPSDLGGATLGASLTLSPEKK